MTKKEFQIQRALGTLGQCVIYTNNDVRIHHTIFQLGHNELTQKHFGIERVILDHIEEHFDSIPQVKY